MKIASSIAVALTGDGSIKTRKMNPIDKIQKTIQDYEQGKTDGMSDALKNVIEKRQIVNDRGAIIAPEQQAENLSFEIPAAIWQEIEKR